MSTIRSIVLVCAIWCTGLSACVGCMGCSHQKGKMSSPAASSTASDADAVFTAAALRHFDSPADACLVMMDAKTGHQRIMNAARVKQRFSPASTSKILNGLIGLDTGVIPDAGYIIKWDGTRHEREINNRDHSLGSAVHYSVVWYFQEITRRVGVSRMQVLINALDYGNKDISSGLTTFWLRGSLRISAVEQVNFIRKLHEGTLPVQPRAMQIMKECLILAQGEGWTFRGKTGTYSGPVDGVVSDLGWFVGWVERDGRAVIFAANDQTIGSMGPAVRAKVARVLVELGELPSDWEKHEREVALP